MRTRLLLLCFLSFYLQAAAQPLPTRISPRWISSNDGLLQNTVRSILQDVDGFLWISTSDGLQKYDGNRFYAITPSDTRPGALISTRQCYLFADGRSNTWISHNRGLSCFIRDQGIFRNILVYPAPVAENLLEGILPIGADGKGNIWLYNKQKGFFYLDIQSFTLTATADKCMGIQFDRGAHLLANPQPDGTCIITDEQHFVHLDFMQNRIIRQSAPITVPSTYLFRLSTGYLASLNGPSGKPFFIPDNGIKTVLPLTAPFGLLYATKTGYDQTLFSFYDQLFYLDKSGMARSAELTNETGRPLINTGNITCLYTDPEGNCWVGTNTQGLFSFRPQPPVFELMRQSAPELNFIRSLYYDSLYHRLWAGSFENGILVYDSSGQLIKHLTPAELSRGQFSKKGYNAFIPCNKEFMIAWGEYTDPVLISRSGFTNKGAISWQIPDSLRERFGQYGQRHYFDRVVMTNENTGWFQFNKSIAGFRISNNQLQLEQLLPVPEFYNDALTVDEQHDLWWGNHSTIYHYTTGRERPELFATTGTALVKSLLPRKDQVWAGTDNGIFIFKKSGKLEKRLNLADGLPNNYIYSLLQDQSGNIWGSTNNGLFRIAAADGQIRHFSTADGLQGKEFNTNAFLQLKDGSLLWGGINGINRLRHPDQIPDQKGNSLFITSIRAGDSLFTDPVYYKKTETLLLPASRSTLTINFSGQATEGFSYRIRGQQEDWQYNTQVRQLNLVLSPGDFELEVKEGQPDENNPVTHLSIIVTPPWYLRWYMKLTGFLLAMLLVAGIVYWVRRRKEMRLRHELETVKRIQQERERISRDLHDHVGAQVTYLLMHVEKAETEKTSDISPLREAGRSIMDTLRETIWALNDTPVTVTGFADKLKTYTRKYISVNAKFEEAITQDLELRKEQVLHLFRICQEVLSNVVKHSEATVLTIRIVTENKQGLQVAIADNGKGFIPEQAAEEGHYGLENMKKRATEAGIGFTLITAPGKGTHVILQLDPA